VGSESSYAVDGSDVTATVPQFLAVLEQHGSTVLFHRESGGTACPCRTREGFRDPAWHAANIGEPVCNEAGFLDVDITAVSVKAAVQPVSGGQRFRTAERANQLLGEVQRDDHLGIFPIEWAGIRLEFDEWGVAGEDFIEYDNRRFTVVAVDKVPDTDGDPDHHYEVGLRLMKIGRPN
jgi:hypothetical protein